MRGFLKALPLSLALVLALAGLGLVLTSCNNSSQAQIRFVHAIWDAGALDIEFNGAKNITDVAFLGVQPTSGYRPVPSGSDTIEGFATGTTTEAFQTENVNLSSGTEYTVVATGNIAGGGNGNVVILNPSDDNAEPPDNYVSFRFIHASPDGPGTVYIYVVPNPVIGNGCSGTVTVNGLSYQQTSTYSGQQITYNANGYTLYVCNAVGGNPIFSGVSLGTIGGPNEGSIRTVVLTDNSGGTGMDSQPIVLNDLN